MLLQGKKFNLWPTHTWKTMKTNYCAVTLLWCDSTWSPASSSGALSTGKTWTCWSRSRGRPQKWSEGWSTSAVSSGWKSWCCSAWRRVQGDVIVAFQYLKEACKKAGEGLFTWVCSNRMRGNGFKLKEDRFILDRRTKNTNRSVILWGELNSMHR